MEHSGHRHHFIEEVFDRHKQVIDRLECLDKKLAFISEKITAFEKRMTGIVENRDQVKDEIQATGKQIIVQIHQSIGWLEDKTGLEAEQKQKFVDTQKREAERKVDMLQRYMKAVKELRMGSHQGIVAGKRKMADRMNTVASQVTKDKYSFKEEADIHVRFKKWNATVGEVDFSLVVHEWKVAFHSFSWIYVEATILSNITSLMPVVHATIIYPPVLLSTVYKWLILVNTQ